MSQQINLFNPIFLKREKYFSAITMLQGLGLILAGSILVMIYARAQLSSLEAEAKATAVRLKSTQAQLAKVTTTYGARPASKALEQEIRKVESDIRVQQQVLAVVHKGNFDRTQGYSEYFRALARQIVDGLWLTGFTIVGTGSGIELHGRALRPELVPEYINRLKREPVMEGKSFSALQMDMPLLDAAGKSEGSGVVKIAGRTPAGYLEFSLQSSEVVAMKADKRDAASVTAMVSGAQGK